MEGEKNNADIEDINEDKKEPFRMFLPGGPETFQGGPEGLKAMDELCEKISSPKIGEEWGPLYKWESVDDEKSDRAAYFYEIREGEKQGEQICLYWDGKQWNASIYLDKTEIEKNQNLKSKITGKEKPEGN